MIQFINDPFKVVIQAFEELFPNLDAEIQFNPTMDYENKEYGRAIFPDDGSTPLIEINPKLSVENAIEIIAHELAHIAAGIDSEHNEKWETAFQQIHEKYVYIIESELNNQTG